MTADDLFPARIFPFAELPAGADFGPAGLVRFVVVAGLSDLVDSGLVDSALSVGSAGLAVDFADFADSVDPVDPADFADSVDPAVVAGLVDSAVVGFVLIDLPDIFY